MSWIYWIKRPFDQTDFDILKSYEAVVDRLAMLIGSHCEIVLHSLQVFKMFSHSHRQR
ncbi:hypothetical protein ACVXHA_10005 [Escherichia coli]